MSVSKWAYSPEICDGNFCPGECDECPRGKQMAKAEKEKKEAKHGKWERRPDPYGFFDDIPVCSECGCTTKYREETTFCPNCGADMRGE